jgi:hypothetical protein
MSAEINYNQEVIDCLNNIRQLVETLRPQECCQPQPITAGGKTSMVCSNDCHWQELEGNVATALVYAEVASHRITHS